MCHEKNDSFFVDVFVSCGIGGRFHRINNIPSGPWLYLGGEPQTLARWPNDKWATFTNAVDKGEKGPGAFVFEGDRIKSQLRFKSV